MKESTIQQQICEYLSLLGIFYFSIPNEHYNISHAQRTQLRKMGLLPGMPDIGILENNNIYFIEIKTASGRLTEQQTVIHEILKKRGYTVEVCRSVEDVAIFLKRWGIV